MTLTPADIARFWSHVDVRDPGECWPWTRARSGNGYGRFSAAHRLHTASRIAYELTHGPLGAAEARHTCDNPPCCNPAHLIAGSHAQNMADMAARERSPRRRLTGAQVTEIRARRSAGALIVTLAAEFGVTPSNVSQIVRRRTWKHLGEAA
ncbi:HNH endonuclease [uncultured Microbacterium sp.]|uniref:HNH endonuclease n=1 Tax=uncultured Microbacterium sp. TaxID=191216 RepID=UPI0025F7577A|nr:HNH endonuclease [uncultured Microbacterium sp.]